MKMMKNPPTRSILRGLALALAVTALACYTARAVPYASCVTNNAGTVSYYLNEAADDVTIIFDGGGAGNTNALGAQVKGLHANAFTMGSHSTYAIQVSKTSPAGWVKTSDDSNALLQFNVGRGITVNYNPQDTRLFGRIYVANAYLSGGKATNVNLHTSRTLTQGLYALNADQTDALGQGNTGKVPTGIVFNPTSGSDPYKIAVGKNDSNVYVNTYSSADSTTWSVDGDLGTATQVLAGTPSNAVHYCYINSPVVTGTMANGNMTLWGVEAEKVGHYCQIAQWIIGSGGLPWNYAPNFLGWCDKAPATLGVADIVCDIDLGADGKVFTSVNRAAGLNDTAGIKVYTPDGTSTVLWNSLTASGGSDRMSLCRAIQISPDGTMLAAVRDNGEFQIIRLTNGLPDISSLVTITNNPGNTSSTTTWAAKDIAWDAAGNIYTLGWTNNYGVRVYSPGGTTISTTANDTTGLNGTFAAVNILPVVSIFATQPNASEDGTTGTFTFSRTGDTTASLTVNYTVSGTATNGVNYVTLSGTTSIPAGVSSVDVIVTPIAVPIPKPTLTVNLTISISPTYFVGTSSATVYISDANPPVLSVAANIPSMYERFPSDYAGVQLARSLGNTNVAVTLDVTNFTFSGTAVMNVDYVVLSNSFPFTMDLGVRSINFNKLVSPLDNATYQGNRTIVVALAAGAGFTVTTGNTPLTILDDENPPATVLLANPLTDPADAIHWNITYGTGDETNYPANYNVDFGYDLTTDPTSTHGIISLPPNGATKALRITCNKLFNPGAAGGVNVYYTNRAFSGDYAVRFNMNVIEGRSYTTEGVQFGINHSGSLSNWWWGSGPLYGGPWASDGVWYYVSADPGGAVGGDYFEYIGLGGTNGNTGWQRLSTKTWTAFGSVFKDPDVFTTVEGSNGGVPANGSPLGGYSTSNWCDVEIKQVRNVVTLAIDKTPIFAYTNTTVWTNGYLMLGYADPFGGTGGVSVGSPEAAAYFANLLVVRLGPPTITGLSLSGVNVSIQFSSSDGDDTTSSFSLQSCGTVNGTYTDVAPAATFTQNLSTGTFQTVYPKNGNIQFYRLRHN
jgi:hypothetical protein